jgi:hypothetical protein
MLCHDEAHAKPFSFLTPDEIENMLNTSSDDDFGSDMILSPDPDNLKKAVFELLNKLKNLLDKITNNFLEDNTTNESVTITNTAKRSIRNVDNITNVSLAQFNITKVQQNLNTSTESVLPNKVTENQTQPNIINYSLVTSSAPSADFLSAAFMNSGLLINNDTKQNNNTRVNNISNILLYSLSTWYGFTAIKSMNILIIINIIIII